MRWFCTSCSRLFEEFPEEGLQCPHCGRHGFESVTEENLADLKKRERFRMFSRHRPTLTKTHVDNATANAMLASAFGYFPNPLNHDEDEDDDGSAEE